MEKNVLIVDDEEIVLDVLQKMFSNLGYTTVVSNLGKDAMEKFSAGNFNIVLLDLFMPDTNGFKLAQQIRNIRPDQEIVLVTGMGDRNGIDSYKLKECRIDYVLPKPFSFNKVKSIISQIESCKETCRD